TRWPRDWSSDVCSSDLRLSFDETRHQHALGFDEGDHLGADARGGRQTAGLALDAAVDAKQASAFRRNADDEDLVVDGDTIVAVRSEERRVGKECRSGVG